MISAILYGRNDAHGYNLHKRAAISLNCIAEVLADDDDEIIFVDYNTPNDLPTFIEAIYDTLTDRARGFLRVLRVRPELHDRMVGRTHLFALEPHSRNIAIRRSNPRNRWVLLTNTDMVFVPKEGFASLDDAAADLVDGLYILPRFELPEPLWEALPRADPQSVIRTCDELGTRLHLNEIAITHPYMRFDSPGDFQLMPRQVLFDIHGFDERMIHGWHADSNICKRLYLHYGHRTESLADRLKGYHCDHTRVATLAHRLDLKLENDLQEFVYGVDDPVAPDQAHTWGVPDEPVEEIDFAGGPQARFVVALETALPGPQTSDYHSDANDLRNFVFYQPEHALPFLAGNLTVCRPQARFAYVGNNPAMLELAARCVALLGFAEPLHYLDEVLTAGPAPAEAVSIRSSDLESGETVVDHLVAGYDLLIFDFGLAPDGIDLPSVKRVTDWPRPLRYSLGRVAHWLEDCAERSNVSKAAGGSVPEFVVINANHYVFRQFVGQFMLSTDTPWNTHVRKGRPRLGDECLYRSHAWQYTVDCMRSFFGYDAPEVGLHTLQVGTTIDLTSSATATGWKDGHWGWIDASGTWTDGPTAHIRFIPPTASEDDLLAYVRVSEAFIGPDNAPIRVGVWLDDEQLAHWAVATRYGISAYRLLLPKRLWQDNQEARLTFHIENPQSTARIAQLNGQQLIGEDPRELGIKVQRISFVGSDQLRYTLGQTIDFTELGRGVDYINECWTQPDNLGSWTIGRQASLIIFAGQPVDAPLNAVFEVTDVAVSAAHPHLEVGVSFNGCHVADWRLGPSRLIDIRKLVVPAEIVNAETPLRITFDVAEPRTPVQLGWSDSDVRQLGFRLTHVRLEPLTVPDYRLGGVIDFTVGGNAQSFQGAEWAEPDTYGAWTLGQEATLMIHFPAPLTTGIAGWFVISDCMVSESVPSLPVRLKANGTLVAEWLLGPDRMTHERRVEVPAQVVEGQSHLTWTFEVPTPRTPASLGWSGDARPLGVRITKAAFADVGVESSDVWGSAAEERPGLLNAALRRLRVAASRNA